MEDHWKIQQPIHNEAKRHLELVFIAIAVNFNSKLTECNDLKM